MHTKLSTNTRTVLCSLLILSLITPHVAFGALFKDLPRQIQNAQNAVNKSILEAAKQKEEQAKREAQAAAARKAELKAREENLRKEREAEERRLREMKDLEALRKTTQAKIDELAAANADLFKKGGELEKAQSALANERDVFKHEREILEKQKELLSVEKELLEAQKKAAEQSGLRWFLGFALTLGTTVIGGLGAYLEIAKKRAEIKKLTPVAAA